MNITRVTAPNPGLFTGPGTNSYVIEDEGECLILDPGPMIPEHLDALRMAVTGMRVRSVASTHGHSDHAPAVVPLAAEFGASALGPGSGGPAPLRDGDTLHIGGSELRVVATPGHTADHVCLFGEGALFSGDHVMGGSTVVIDDLAAYLDSLRRLLPLEPRRIHPGHGPDIDRPVAVITEYLEHRMDRERQIVAAIEAGAGTVGEIVERVYADVDRALHFAAAMSVTAHLEKLASEGRLEFEGGAVSGAQVSRKDA